MKSIGKLLAFAVCACVGLQGSFGRAAEVRLGNMKAEKILFLGNSITAVPQRDQPIWWGLSASSVAKDYAHLLVAAIDAKTGGRLTMLPTTAPTTNPDGSVVQCESNVINIADVFERGYATYNASKISKQLAWKADIVILQFGENIPMATFNADVFKENLKKLVADLKESSHPHMFFAGYILGANAVVDEIKRKVCEEDPTHRIFVDLGSVGKDASNIGDYSHPNDKGMALIADTMFKAIAAHSAAPMASASAAEAGKGVGRFCSVDPAQVQVGGEIGRRIDLTIQKNLLAIDMEKNFLEAFRQKQGASGAYVGLGKVIDSAVGFARYSKDPKVIELKNRLIKELIATQLEDGYLGIFPANSRIGTAWDLHEMAYNIQALVKDYRYFQDKTSLDAARKVADYIVKNRKGADLPRDIKIGIERAMIALSEVTGNPQYRDYAVDGMDLRNWKAPVTGHAYTFMNVCLAQLDLYREKPDESLLAQSRAVIDYLTKNDGLMITGTCSLKEVFHDNQDTRGDLGESCATAYLIRMAHHLLQLEGKTLDGDIMERGIYNALFAAQSPDGRSLRYFTCLDGPRKYWKLDSYCCPGNWRRIVAELPEMIDYRSTDGGVMVNLYTPSTVDVPVASDLSARLRQETDYPNSGKVVIAVEPSRSAEFPLTLRIPRWCESATVAVNGEPAGPAKPGDWHVVKRLWKAGDVVTLDMPMKTRLVWGRKLQAGKVSVMRGPLVFCFGPAPQAGRYPVYAGHGANPAEVQQSIAEAVGQTKFDWSTLSAPVADGSSRPGGLALEVHAWGPASDRNKPADLTLLLTEFIDPSGEWTYLPGDNAAAGVEDELEGNTR